MISSFDFREDYSHGRPHRQTDLRCDITTWDYEATSSSRIRIAGVTAAIEAARAGAEVLVLERTGGWGGAASLAGGFIYLAVERRCRRRAGSRTRSRT